MNKLTYVFFVAACLFYLCAATPVSDGAEILSYSEGVALTQSSPSAQMVNEEVEEKGNDIGSSESVKAYELFLHHYGASDIKVFAEHYANLQKILERLNQLDGSRGDELKKVELVLMNLYTGNAAQQLEKGVKELENNPASFIEYLKACQTQLWKVGILDEQQQQEFQYISELEDQVTKQLGSAEPAFTPSTESVENAEPALNSSTESIENVTVSTKTVEDDSEQPETDKESATSKIEELLKKVEEIKRETQTLRGNYMGFRGSAGLGGNYNHGMDTDGFPFIR